MKKFMKGEILLILVIAGALGFYDLSGNVQKYIFPAAPEKLTKQKILLGLDLQGGTQLDYTIDLNKVPDQDKENIVEGVKEIINKRVNSLGVSEPNIYISKLANESHVIVELAGIKDIEEAKKTVGKTIQLEFKEENTEIEASKKEEIRTNVQSTLDRISQTNEDLKTIAEEEKTKLENSVEYTEDPEFKYQDELRGEIAEKAFAEGLSNGSLIPSVIEIKSGDGNFFIDASGNVKERTGFSIYKLIERVDNAERVINHEKEVKASHILIAYKGTLPGQDDITRTEEEAKTRAEEVLAKVKAEGADFAAIAKEYSDDAGSKEQGGDLGFFNQSKMVKEFADVAFALEKDQISDPVKSQFGYHIIKVYEIKEASTETKVEPKVKLASIFYSTEANPWKDTGLTGEHFVHADVLFQNNTPYVSIKFNSEGAKLFEEITERNVNKQLAIFVGGELISAPNVNEKIAGGSAQITSSNFTTETASNLARDLNTGAIPAPIILSGQTTIGASIGEEALKKSLNAGAIGLLVLALFMILYYRLPGLIANIALLIYITILIFLIKVALPLTWALPIATALFIAILSKILKSKESGWEKFIAFLLSCFILFFLTFVLKTPVVLTLAGIAGVILSIGMAVDANVLIFERIKEEIQGGRPIAAAIEVGFDRAWNSIRDSNFSSLITCGILFYFGTSIIKGFAVNLAMGILVSMFTAITITHTLLRAVIQTKWGSNPKWFGIKDKKAQQTFDFIGKTKTWFTLSGAMMGISLIALIIFGPKFGLDFTGGSLMELKFEKAEISAVQITDALKEKSELGTPNIITTETGSFIIRTKFMENQTHDTVIEELKQKIGNLEETRFTRIGPTVGETLKARAFYALSLALIMIILYIAFAFRRIPKRINPWRFGICAIVALIHDVFITIGIYVIIGKFFHVEIDALFITALLTLMGFSVHDTIVVFDRIRENLKYQTKDQSFEDVTNKALNQTLARSINTSLSTLFTILALFIFGADSIRFFAFALTVGIIVGTYSSIFIASPLLVLWRNWDLKKRLFS